MNSQHTAEKEITQVGSRRISFLQTLFVQFSIFCKHPDVKILRFAIVGTSRYLQRQKHSIFTKAQVEPTIGQLFWSRLYFGPQGLC